MPSKRRGPSGAMELRYIWSESASGHKEQSETWKLFVGENEKIILSIATSDQNFYKMSAGDHLDQHFEIEAGTLVEFIQKNGKRIK